MAPAPPRIAVNGRYLDEIQTRIEDAWGTGSVGYARLPAQHHGAVIDGEVVTLRVPALTVLQLYFDGILPVDRSIPVTLEVDGQSLGEVIVESLRCAERHYAGEAMFPRLRLATPRSHRQPDP